MDNLISYDIMGLQILKQKCGSEQCVRSTWKLILLKTERYLQAVLFAEILRVVLKGRPCKSRHHEVVKVIVCIDSVYSIQYARHH